MSALALALPRSTAQPSTLAAQPSGDPVTAVTEATSWLTYLLAGSAVVGVGAGIYYLANEARYRKEALRDARAGVVEAERSLAALQNRKAELEDSLGRIDKRALGVSESQKLKMSGGKAFLVDLAQIEHEQTTYALARLQPQISEARSELASARAAVAYLEAK